MDRDSLLLSLAFGLLLCLYYIFAYSGDMGRYDATLEHQAAQIEQLQAQQTEILTKINAVQQTQIIERELAGLQEVK